MRRFAALVVCITLAGLVYVYAEIEAVKIGYAIQKQEQLKVQALDRARALQYNIARLEAPYNLERKLQAQRIQLEPPKQWQTLVFSDAIGNPGRLQVSRQSIFQNPGLFGRFFLGTAQAEAKESGRN